MTQLQCPSINLDLIRFPDKVISGQASGTVLPGDTVTIVWPGGATYQTKMKEGGRFAFNSAAAWAARPLVRGDFLGIKVTDAAGNIASAAMPFGVEGGTNEPAGYCGSSVNASHSSSIGPASA
ncbi:hypothetical protein KGA65_09090 [Ideonella sp. B7]|uniref:hypothetical protein n=1 Tax=Ideonella benzenivorans TaxID=2831643 RepID=UPI001CECCC56|nr:hypothetical protein [Ideonella benzenivorans]MCA6216690.1 hypothetical protein [Ideonella benzenivorans]